ncbi:optic atrophy 3 protein-domain-containing protein [Cladochytrium replicatum]|nr:optic atrophy 3 protein-domain-containing protein [Cladochytrium replicatum]
MSALTVKLGSLLLRTLAKPLATSIKNQAKQHPSFKKFCIDVAQTYHRAETNMKMRFLDYKVEGNVRPLNDVRAVELGANFLSEALVFGVAVITVVGETVRQTRKSSKQKTAVEESLETLKEEHAVSQEVLKELADSVKALKTQVEGLQNELEARRQSHKSAPSSSWSLW